MRPGEIVRSVPAALRPEREAAGRLPVRQVAQRVAGLADDVGRRRSREVVVDGDLLVAVGVDLHPPLLHEHPAVVVLARRM